MQVPPPTPHQSPTHYVEELPSRKLSDVQNTKRLSKRLTRIARASFSLGDAKNLMKTLKEKIKMKREIDLDGDSSDSDIVEVLNHLDDSSSNLSDNAEDGADNFGTYGHTGSIPHPGAIQATQSVREIKKSKITIQTLRLGKVRKDTITIRQNSEIRYQREQSKPSSGSKKFHFTSLLPSSHSQSPALATTPSVASLSVSDHAMEPLSPQRSSSMDNSASLPFSMGGAGGAQYLVKKSFIPDPYNDDSPLYILMRDDREVIIGGSLQQLLNALTDERADVQYVEDFLATFRYFTTTEKLLEHFTYRYLYLAPAESSKEELSHYNEWRGPIQLRVINCIRKWLDRHFEDFEKNEELLTKLKSFIKITVSAQNEKWGLKLLDIINARFVTTITEGGVVTPKVGLHSVEVLCALLKTSGLVKDRKWRLTRYKHCFVGQEAVDWMMKQMGMDSRQAACDLGAKLVAHNLIICVSKERNVFKDSAHSFYQFTKSSSNARSPLCTSPHYSEYSVNSAASSVANSANTTPTGMKIHLSVNEGHSGIADEFELPENSVDVVINNFSLSTISMCRHDSRDMMSELALAMPILPRKGVILHVLTIHPKEVARQLTLIEFDMYRSIPLRELSHQRWSKNSGAESPSINRMINRFNEVGFWIATEIVNTFSLLTRIAILKRFIKIAHICKKLNNFNTMMEIAVGLNMGSITRLVKTWQGLDPKSKQRYDGIMELTQSTSNYKNYREKLKECTLPVLPYLGLHLRDLTFMEDGNPDFLSEGIINFHKMRMLGRVFASIINYQRNKFKFSLVPDIQNFLLNGISIERSDNQLYKLSSECEFSRNSLKPT